MLNYIKLTKLFKRLNKHINEVVMGNVKVNWLYVLVEYIIAFDICTYISIRINPALGSFLIFFVGMLLFFLAFTKRVGIGISEEGLMIIHLKRFKLEDKNIYNVPFDKIRSITVSKFGFSAKLKISFISEEGVLEKKKYKFNTFVLGSANQQDDAKRMYEKLIDVQKIIDKGDF